MKRILMLVCMCGLCSCDEKWGAGAGGVSAHIDVGSTDESVVLEKLEAWLTARGFEKQSQSWTVLTGDGEVRINNGEIVQPVAYVKGFSEGEGHIAWGVAPATASHRFVTVFHDAEYAADRKEALTRMEVEANRETGAFHQFVDTGFPRPSAAEPSGAGNGGESADRSGSE